MGAPAEELSDPIRVEAQMPAAPRDVALVKRRNEAIDVVRLFAAAGIVFVHAAQSRAFAPPQNELPDWSNLFRFGVPFFLFASLYFQSLSLRRNTGRTLLQYIAGRLKRLYLPFLVWSAIYLFTRDVKRIAIAHLGLVKLHPAMLWTGTEYHLWFLPFLLGWSVVLAVIYHGLLRHDRRLRWLMIGAAIIAGYVVVRIGMPVMPAADVDVDNPIYTYVQWRLALPAACWGIAFAWFMTMGPAVLAVPFYLGWGGIALVIAFALKQVAQGIQLGSRGLTGLGSMLAAMVPWNGAAMSTMARFGRMGYGIYLCHVLPVEVLHVAADRLHLEPAAWLDVMIFAISFIAAAVIVTVLGKSPRTAWLNG